MKKDEICNKKHEEEPEKLKTFNQIVKKVPAKPWFRKTKLD